MPALLRRQSRPRHTTRCGLLPMGGQKVRSVAEEEIGLGLPMAFVAACCFSVAQASGQMIGEHQLVGEQVWVYAEEDIRVVLPRSVADSGRAQTLAKAVRVQGTLPGFPNDVLNGYVIRISVATAMESGFDAKSYAADALIVVPLNRAFLWPADRLHRAVRHELAHIALTKFLDNAVVPTWFAEGFAEWVAGELPCDARTRLSEDLAIRIRHGLALPELLSSATPRILSRLAYDYYATIFGYLEETGAPLAGGKLLRLVRDHGVEGGLTRAVGADLETFEKEWQASLMRLKPQQTPEGAGVGSKRDFCRVDLEE